PDNLMRRRTTERPNRQRQTGAVKGADDRLGAPQLPELGKNQVQPGLHFLIRIEDDSAARPMRETRRQRQTKFATSGLLTFPLMETHLDLMEFGFAHDPRQAEQQAIVIGPRIIEPFAIGNEHAEERAQLEQLMPIAVVARQTRCVEAQHEAGLAQADLGDEALKTETRIAGSTRLPEIFVDNLDSVARPTQHRST